MRGKHPFSRKSNMLRWTRLMLLMVQCTQTFTGLEGGCSGGALVRQASWRNRYAGLKIDAFTQFVMLTHHVSGDVTHTVTDGDSRHHSRGIW
eukprot:1361755-Amorphochlora_amoeboformis.AAC.2